MLNRSEGRSRFDWVYIFAISGLVLLGSLAIFSAASPMPHYGVVIQKHLISLLLGFCLFTFGLTFNYQVFQDQAKIMYALAIGALICVLVFGAAHKGHRAWIQLPFFSFQPSELARVCTILVLAAFLTRRARRAAELETVIYAFALVAPVLFLIMKEPDFATTLLFFPVLLAMLFCAGSSVRHLAAMGGYGFVALGLPLLVTWIQIRFAGIEDAEVAQFVLRCARFGWPAAAAMGGSVVMALAAWQLFRMARLHPRPATFILIPIIFSAGLTTGIAINKKLKGYQRERFVAYVAPQEDSLGASYHVIQSQIAIGSGGIIGKGLFGGTQSQLGFLPERHTDFIYAVVGEEMGFWGSTAILSLYLLLIWRVIVAARASRDTFGFLVCCGLGASLASSLFLNVGMCVGLMPVAGVPLPLVSYGGSSLAITLWSLGVVGNVYSRRYALL
jgi:rod shape determining protein RodA